MKKIKFNQETGNAIIETDNGYKVLTRLHQLDYIKTQNTQIT